MKTKEEKIIFQNQSHLVQKFYESCGICPDLIDICLATDLMVDYVESGYITRVKERFDTFQKYIDNKYGKETTLQPSKV